MQTSHVRLLRGAAFAGLTLLAPSLPGQVGAVDPAVPVFPPGSNLYRMINNPRWNDVPLAVASASGAARPAHLVNVSVRADAGTPTTPLIVGAGIQGEGNLPVLVRAIGPGLSRFGVTDALKSAPDLAIFEGSAVAAKTNNVAAAAIPVAVSVGAFPASNDGSKMDAALVGQLGAGVITAHCSSSNSGSVLLEFYDAGGGSSTAHLVNLSSRGTITAATSSLVVGFVVAGEGETSVLLRGVGASLQSLGVANPIGDPRIELYSGSTLLAANDDWRGSGDTEIEAVAKLVGAFPLASTKDAALLLNLKAGAYTLHVRSATGAAPSTGTVLAEVYEARAPITFDAARATNALGLELYRQLVSTATAGNLIISPYSIESALALAYVGAAGDTRVEMARVLRLPSDNATVQSGFAKLRDALAQTGSTSIAVAQARSKNGAHFDPIEWNVANRIFGQQDFAFRDSYVSLLRDGFAAPLQPLDFIRDAEQARLTINAWVSDQTRNKINDLIPPGGVASATRFALVNALYLKAPWDVPFEKFATAIRSFHLAGGTARDVPMMQRTGYLGYANEAGLTVVALPYLGQELQCLLLLPSAAESVNALATRLAPEDFARWAALNASSTYVALSLPKFTVPGSTAALGPALRALGMATAFDVPPGSANFDGIAPRSGRDSIALTEVFHQTFVAVDEQGTEAAAATAVIGGVTSIPITPVPIEVRLDRPFLFAIQHRATGACLFVGRIDDPK